MAQQPEAVDLEHLLAHAAWVSRLARSLVGNSADAEDLVQETWLAALRHRPASDRPLRPWLAQVVRNFARLRWRAETHRSTREEVAEAQRESQPTPEQLVEETELQSRLAALVVDLPEPYRTTILFRYHRGLSAAEIARQQGIPGATVRTRLARGLDMLRQRLDETHGGDRQKWAVVFSPLMRPRGGTGWGSPAKGVLVMKGTLKLGIILCLLFALAAGGWRLLSKPRILGDAHRDNASGAAAWWSGGRGRPSVTLGDLPSWFGQKGVPPRRIAGRVTFEGRPFPGAEVRLTSAAWDGLLEQPPVRADTAGRFDFGVWPAASFTVDAQAPGKAPDQIVVDLRDPAIARRSDELELRLGPCSASLFGVVRDASGGTIVGAKVRVRPIATNDIGSGGAVAVSDGKGAYDLCVPMGATEAQVDAQGYGAVIFRLTLRGRVHRDFPLVPEAVVVGRVVRADDGSPVPGALVRLWPMSWGLTRARPGAGVADTAGRFRIVGVAAVRYQLDASADGMLAASPIHLAAEAGHTTPEQLIRLIASHSLDGVVIDRGTGKPVEGATVTTVVPGVGDQSPGSVVTQSDGVFHLERERGGYELRVYPWHVVQPKSISVGVRDQSGIRVEVEALATLRGRVMRRGEPIAGALVHAHGPSGWLKGQSDSDGRFVLRGFAPGAYHLYASAAQLESFGVAKGDPIPLGAREVHDVGDIELSYSARISGVVVDQKGAPVDNVWVDFKLIDGFDEGSCYTAPDGTFSATQMTGGGDYRPLVKPAPQSQITFSPVSGGREFPAVHVADGASVVDGVRLQIRYDRFNISGKVTDAAGVGQADVRVLAAVQPPGQEAQFLLGQDLPTTTTGMDGTFILSDLAAGTYALQARAADANTAQARNVQAGQQGVALILQGTGAVGGDLVGFSHPPEIIANRVGNSVQPVWGTVEGAHFHLRPLDPGSWRVEALSDEGGDIQVVNVTAGAEAQVTLRSRGSANIVGRAVEFRSGAPVPGLFCFATPALGRERVAWPFAGTASAGDDGSFSLDPVPAGQVRVECEPIAGDTVSSGVARVTLANGQRGTVEVPVVQQRHPNVHTQVEFTYDFGSDDARILSFPPGGVVDKAGIKSGDIILTVDGQPVDKLTPSGVYTLIIDRAPGSHARLSLLRRGQTVAADLVVPAAP